MNRCREIVEKGVPARHREPARSGEAGGPPGNRRVLVPEAYLNSTSQGPTPEDALKDSHILGRSK
ncbi:MAG: hypothetical protein JSV14_11465 [Deltaproteobacteria bacterium]|nr:MAG: hypothetical protein JSV14_11465 [Deltaproteobacteria bacterium]